MEEMMITDVNCQIKYWELLFTFAMVAAQMDPNYNNSSVLDMDVEPVTAIDPKNCKWEDQRLYATLGTSPIRSPVTYRGGT